MFFISGTILAADPVTMNITGNIVASPCQVSSDSISKSVDLGQDIQSSALQTAGTGSDWVMFHIDVVSCPVGTTKATMTLHGTPDNARPDDLYANSGSAENVAVQLQMQSGEAMGNDKSYVGNISSSGYVYNMQARAYTANGSATPGTISSVVTATFEYQ